MSSLFEQGRPKFGRFESAPQRIDIKDFVYTSPFGRQINGVEKKLRYKQFQFISLNNQQMMISLAVADLAWVGYAFFYWYDKTTNTHQEFAFLQPLAYNTVLNNQQKGETFFNKHDFVIHIRRLANKRKVLVKKGKTILLDAVLDLKGQEPLALCTPTGATGWTYTQKMTTLPVKGQALVNGELIQLEQHDFRGGIDDTCGMLRNETAWRWLSLSGQSTQSQQLGLNLAAGVNETGATENSLWLDGKLIELPAMNFEQVGEQEWHIGDASQMVNLRAKTGWCRHEAKNFLIVASQFKQWISEISGTITVDGQQIEISQQLGLVEQHYAKW